MPQGAELEGADDRAPALPRVVLDPDGVLRDADDAAARLLGRAREQLHGVPVQELLAGPRHVAAVEDALAAARAGEVAGQARVHLRTGQHRPDDRPGTPVDLAWAVTSRGDRGPREITAFLVGLDQTVPRRLAARLRGRFEQSALPQAFCDLDGILIEVNDAFCRLLDQPGSALAGRPVSDLRHRSDDGNADPALAQLLRGERPVHRYERILARADGRPVPVLVDASLVRDDAGSPLGAAAFFQDLTLLRDVEHRRSQQEEFFLALARRASDLAIVNDAEGRVLYASPALTSMLGYDAADVLLEPGIGFVHPEDVPATLETFARVVAEGGAATTTLRVRDTDGTWHWVEQTASNLLDTAIGGVVCNLRDISEQVHAQEALRASEARYRAIADNADEGLWLSDAQRCGIYANARLAEMLGLPPDELLGRPIDEVLAASPRRAPHTPDAHGGRGGQGGRAHAASAGIPERYELTWRRRDGTVRILSVSESALEDAEGRSEGWLAMVSDVTTARQAEESLRRAAETDALTGLPNRISLTHRLQEVLARVDDDVAVLFVDLDRFKIVNDARGHAVGDNLLCAVAARLLAVTRAGDTVARFGGDEFLVVSPGADERRAAEVAQSLLSALDDPFRVAGGEAALSASIGVALRRAGETTSATALLRQADTAMYAAKLAGRSGVRVFDEALARRAEERFELGGDLRRALILGDLELHYQPVIDLLSGDVLGAEALARWPHPRHGQVPPNRFVALAEETGLSSRLDHWALHRAVRDAGALRRRGVLTDKAYVAVNVSAPSLSDPQLERWIHQQLEVGDLAAENLLVEVTESAIMSDATAAVALLRRLRALGVGVAVDDFGTGHSSLAYLRDLPISVLKIDRTFVARLSTDPSSLAIARSIIELARAVGVAVVAEGVETLPDAELLRGLGCDAAQGWLWSAAVPPADALGTDVLSRRYVVSS